MGAIVALCNRCWVLVGCEERGIVDSDLDLDFSRTSVSNENAKVFLSASDSTAVSSQKLSVSTVIVGQRSL